MEYRAVIEIPSFPASHENELGFALLEALDEHTNMGPVMSGPGPGEQPGATVTLATDAPDEAAALGAMTAALRHALKAAGLEDLQLGRIELEPVEGQERAHIPG